MPIDMDLVVGAELPAGSWAWGPDAVILYHLGLGAGVPATDAAELEYTYEAHLKVLPSFGVLPVFGTLMGLLSVDGLDINPMMVLHGEQGLTIHRPLPTSATVDSTARIVAVHDKGKGALLVIEAETVERGGELLCTNRFAAFVRGEGGFGGSPGPAPGNDRPDRDPDLVVTSPTIAQQALLYRLSGDKNPLHADPEMAALGGFDRPILHGLCTYGIVCKAAVDAMLDGDVTRVEGYDARFAGVVFPGETVLTSLWDEGDRIVISSLTRERSSPVITNAALRLRS